MVSGIGIIYQIIDKMIASFLPAGSISALNFAQRVFLIPYGLLATSILVSVYPSFSTYAVKEDNGNYLRIFEKSLFSLAYIMIPISVLFVVFSHTIVQLLFESTAYQPNSPYSATKASSDHLVRSYFKTYGLPITISNCSNDYGPYQFPEKLIPLMILNILEEKPLPVYGDGKNIRDWLYVEDHCLAIWKIINYGRIGETYNIGGEKEWENIRLINFLCERIERLKKKNREYYKRLITFVKDRPGHDRRYAINCDKIKNELGWEQQNNFEKGLDY